MRHIRWRYVLVGLALVLGFVIVAFASMHPSNDREWKLEHSVLPYATFQGDSVRIQGIRNFSYQSADSFTPGYYDETFDLAKIESVSFILSVFKPHLRGLAHSFLSFGFEDGKYVSISVEARQEKGEAYSIWKGLAKRFEIIYVIGDERDLIGTRAVQRTDQVYLYPIKASREQRAALFVEMLQAANDLRERPVYYNTLLDNCTTRLLEHANRIADDKIPGGWRILLPGYADELAYELGLIDTELELARARERFLINVKARRYADSDDFSELIRKR